MPLLTVVATLLGTLALAILVAFASEKESQRVSVTRHESTHCNVSAAAGVDGLRIAKRFAWDEVASAVVRSLAASDLPAASAVAPFESSDPATPSESDSECGDASVDAGDEVGEFTDQVVVVWGDAVKFGREVECGIPLRCGHAISRLEDKRSDKPPRV